MKVEIATRMPESMCYRCGSTKIEKVCHHCGRAMCESHGPYNIPETKNYFRRVVNEEFTELDITEHEIIVHCEHCQHAIVSYAPIFHLAIWIGAVTFIISLIASAIPPILLIASITFFIGILGLFLDQRECFNELRKHRPPLPIFGLLPSVNIQESFNGHVTITHRSRYIVGQIKTSGSLTFSTQFNNYDQERLNQYRKKYRLEPSILTQFHAGFIIASERSFTKRSTALPDWSLAKDNPLFLLGDVLGQQLFHANDVHNGEWNYHEDYELISRNPSIRRVPVDIVPTLLSEGEEEWALEMYVQVNPMLSAPLSSPLVKNLVLKFPHSFGQFESYAPSADINPKSSETNVQITWRNVNLESQEKQTIHNRPLLSKSFYVRFVGSKGEPKGQIWGSLDVHFTGTLSNLDNIVLFSPLGEKIKSSEVTFIKKTLVRLSFKFDLEKLQVRRHYQRDDYIEQLAVIPGNESISRLVNAFSAKQIYVQRVMEEPPRMNWANANNLNRHWVLVGRRYEGALPIDFQLVSTGKEQYESGSDRPFDGISNFRITTQGIVITDDMESKIDALRTDIKDIIRSVPNLDIIIIPEKFREHKWKCLLGRVRNESKTIARNIEISISGVRSRDAKFINRESGEEINIMTELTPGEEIDFEISIYPDFNGMVPIVLSATCKDEYGQLPPWKKRYKLEVLPNPSLSNIQANFNAPVSVSGSMRIGGNDSNGSE